MNDEHETNLLILLLEVWEEEQYQHRRQPPETTTHNHYILRLFHPFHPISLPEVQISSMKVKKRSIGYSNQTNFGPVPSQIEVQNAISDLRRAMNGFCATNLEINEIGEIIEQCDYDSSRTVMKSLGQKRLLDAYHLMQTDPLVQRLVLSISSDTEVWNAILKNDAVQDLQGSLPLAGETVVPIAQAKLFLDR
ncbi:hypothetical protein L1987_03276 [Smallanthus sonchifolius]|uniref:Uncharacterized protein n=1 Tax=Smallanthus sonchifolius TaxID=185202 RepID=A0ACB9KAF4_9ASTR|nr:hypothetical protein L1987_03276 [Smallanthus sonchifolius]